MRDDERELYRLHARLPVYRRHLDQAVGIVRRAMAEHPGKWAVACSGGKDSCALACLAHEAGWRGELFHVAHPEMPARNTDLVHCLGLKLGLPVRVAWVPGAAPKFEELGYAFAHPTTAAERAALRRIERDDDEAAAQVALDAGYVGTMVGIRMQESRVRAIAVRRWGVIHSARARATMIAWPIAFMTARDVWSVLLHADAPWLPAYDLAADRETAHSPTAWVSNGHAWANGFAEQVRSAEPELWSRMIARWPELQRWM